MKLPIYKVDAFSGRLFSGNPAGVCPLDSWLPDQTMQAIAAENNLSETAFFIPKGDDFELRWFTPSVEVDLCGHATLASALVILSKLQPQRKEVRFWTKSGPLLVRRKGDLLELDFPSRKAVPIETPLELKEGLKQSPAETLKANDYLAVFENEEQIRGLRPDFSRLLKLGDCVIVTAPGKDVDFVSRYFAPAFGIPEDPATGSAHCTLVPYWSERLGKQRLTGRQVSARVGEFYCEDRGERVGIAGKAVLYLEGIIYV